MTYLFYRVQFYEPVLVGQEQALLTNRYPIASEEAEVNHHSLRPFHLKVLPAGIDALQLCYYLGNMVWQYQGACWLV